VDAWIRWVEGNEALLVATAILSALTFFGTLALVPVLLGRMPANYFAGDQPPDELVRRVPPSLRLFARILKNLLGLVLLGMGFVMLFIPGQGVLTMLLGIALLDFPGKRKLERRIASRPRVRKSIDWIRERKGQPPLQFDDEPEDPPSRS
jgi:hypothetical protein